MAKVKAKTPFAVTVQNGDKEIHIMEDLAYGQIGRIVYEDTCEKGALVIRSYDVFISLENPADTWDLNCDLKIEILPPGTSVTITSSN